MSAEFPEYEVEKPGEMFTSLLTTNHEDVPQKNSHLEVVQSELEILLLSATLRLRSLSREVDVVQDPDGDELIQKRRGVDKFVPKRRQSKILQAANEAKKKRTETPQAAPVLPRPAESEQFWSVILRGCGPVSAEGKKILTDAIDNPVDKKVFKRMTRQSKRYRNPATQNVVLSARLNKALEGLKEETGATIKQESGSDIDVKDRLIQAGVYLDDDNEVLTELAFAQEEFRNLVNQNNMQVQLMYKLVKNSDKLHRNTQKLFEVDKELTECLIGEKYNTESFEAKLRLREKYTRNIDKYKNNNELWLKDI